MYPVRRQTSPHAARLRRERTDAKNKLWQAIRNRQLEGFKFLFQASLYPYVVDFLCVEVRVIVELDGGQHTTEKDAARTKFLKVRGYHVLRFWNNDVMQNLDGVATAILLALRKAKKKALTQPSPAKAGEGLEEAFD